MQALVPLLRGIHLIVLAVDDVAVKGVLHIWLAADSFPVHRRAAHWFRCP